VTIRSQVQRLVELGLCELAGVSADRLRTLAEALAAQPGVLAVHPSLVPASRLAPLLTRHGKPGFVVEDMTDLDEFVPIKGLEVPEEPLYLVTDVDRGDRMRSWTPAEALPEIAAASRTPLTINEGISWLLQEPSRLEPNHCFMCIGSRKPKGAGLDARTPALWISGGTGHDGPARRDAPKVGWCWVGNRHTWLGFASGSGRVGAAA
jgi:hypothetical protein